MSSPRVQRVTSADTDHVIDILVGAFEGYAAMDYMLGPEAGSDGLEALVGYFARSRLRVGSPVLGIWDDGGPALIAAALVDPPNPPQRSGLEQLRIVVGDGAIERLERFAKAVAPLEPAEPHHYVGMIGVASHHRGRGLARALLDHVHLMSASDPTSVGVVLTTEDPNNLRIYGNIGYEIIGEAVTSDGLLRSWTLIRPS